MTETNQNPIIPQKVKIKWLKTKIGHIPGEVLEVERDLAVFLIARGDAELI